MSWDADLTYPGVFPATVLSQNYTHNTNRMISAALEAATGDPAPPCDGPLGRVIGPAWWHDLNGASGATGSVYLGHIVLGLESDPDLFRAMNPENGWGTYDDLLVKLRRMRDASAEHPGARWTASG